MLMVTGTIAGLAAASWLMAGEAAHRVRPQYKGERPVLDDQVPESPAENVVPESVQKVSDKLKIVTRTFKPPHDDWDFKDFGGNPLTYVDVFRAPGSLAPIKNPDSKSLIKVTVEDVPFNTAENFPVRCEGNLKPPSGKKGEPPYWRANTSKIKVDLDIDGLDEEKEDDPGAVVVRNFDGNNASRKKIILRAAEGASYGDKQVLTRASDKVFTAATGGTEITFKDGDNEFEATESKDLYVEGVEASQNMGDVKLKLALKNNSEMCDEVTFTVLWVVILEWKNQPTQSISDTNSRKGQYTQWNEAHKANLGLNDFAVPGGRTRGWGYEVTGQVYPSNFTGQIEWRQDAESRMYGSPPPGGTTEVGKLDWTPEFPNKSDDGPDDS
jgi:hypothetical protein